MFLTKPSAQYKESYLKALKEFHGEGRNLRFDAVALEKDFESFVQELLDRADKNKLKPGKVSESIFWLIDGEEFIGRVSVRHELTEYLLNFAGHIGYEIRPTKRRMNYGKNILRLGLEEAKKLGLPKALITCSAVNTGSRKIIEANGGLFENEVASEGETELIRRYWIDIA